MQSTKIGFGLVQSISRNHTNLNLSWDSCSLNATRRALYDKADSNVSHSFMLYRNYCALQQASRKLRFSAFFYLVIGALAAMSHTHGIRISDKSGLYYIAETKLERCKRKTLPENDPFLWAYKRQVYLAFAYLCILEYAGKLDYGDEERVLIELNCTEGDIRKASQKDFGNPFHVIR